MLILTGKLVEIPAKKQFQVGNIGIDSNESLSMYATVFCIALISKSLINL
jgi:hypothetical protein